MKNLVIILSLLFSTAVFSQVIIGDDIGIAADKTSVLMEFADTGDRGIILPWVTDLPSGQGLAEGTLFLDASVNNATEAKVVYRKGNAWVDLSAGNRADISALVANTQPDITEDPDSKVIIGADSSNANGVLILESTEKVLLMPRVEKVADIINPAPGMMVYVTGDMTDSNRKKRLAVFNGAKWTFWAPSN